MFNTLMTDKFGLELPMKVEEAIAIDEKKRNTLWQDAIEREMKNVKIAFQILPEGEKAPHSSQYVNCHMVFDIKWRISIERHA